MTYRVQVEAAVQRSGYVDIEAETAEEAIETVQRLGKARPATALNIEWTGATRQGAVKVLTVEEA